MLIYITWRDIPDGSSKNLRVSKLFDGLITPRSSKSPIRGSVVVLMKIFLVKKNVAE